MGCNCGKGQRRPLGLNGTANGANGASTTQPQQQQLPLGTGAPQGKRISDGGLGAPKGTTQSFALTTTSGRTQTFGSRLEAEAARVRAGGGSIVVG